MIRGFLLGILTAHRGLGYGYTSHEWKAEFRWVQAGCRWWERWRHPVRHLVTSWKLRKL